MERHEHTRSHKRLAGAQKTTFASFEFSEELGFAHVGYVFKADFKQFAGFLEVVSNSNLEFVVCVEKYRLFEVYVDQGCARAPATDPGSDDLTFRWDWNDGTDDTAIYYNDGIGPDPYPSPWGTYPFSATEQMGHIYSESGTYTVVLTVEDDDGGVDTATYEITVLNAEEAKHVINDHIQGLPDDAFKNNPDQRKKAFNNMFSAVDDMLDDEEYLGVIHHLQCNVQERTDGFVGGSAKNDWITDLTAQEYICWKLSALIAYLETLVRKLINAKP